MKLNSAIFETLEINGSEMLSLYDMIRQLRITKDIIAEVYINSKLAFTSMAILSEDSGYMFAYINGVFSLSEDVIVENIQINVKQAGRDFSLFKSYTVVNDLIQSGDYRADLCFKVINTAPFCTNIVRLRDSKFTPLKTNKLTPIVLEDQPSANENVLSTCTLTIKATPTEVFGVECNSWVDYNKTIYDVLSSEYPENTMQSLLNVDADGDGVNDSALFMWTDKFSINIPINRSITIGVLINIKTKDQYLCICKTSYTPLCVCKIHSIEDDPETGYGIFVIDMPTNIDPLYFSIKINNKPNELDSNLFTEEDNWNSVNEIINTLTSENVDSVLGGKNSFIMPTGITLKEIVTANKENISCVYDGTTNTPELVSFSTAKLLVDKSDTKQIYFALVQADSMYVYKIVGNISDIDGSCAFKTTEDRYCNYKHKINYTITLEGSPTEYSKTINQSLGLTKWSDVVNVLTGNTPLDSSLTPDYNGNIKIINSLSVSSFTSNPQLACNNISVCYNSSRPNGNIIISKTSSESTNAIDELIANDENNTLTIKFAMSEFID